MNNKKDDESGTGAPSKVTITEYELRLNTEIDALKQSKLLLTELDDKNYSKFVKLENKIRMKGIRFSMMAVIPIFLSM